MARLHRRSLNVIPTPCMQIQLGQAATRVGAATSMEGRTEMHICFFGFGLRTEIHTSHASLEEFCTFVNARA